MHSSKVDPAAALTVVVPRADATAIPSRTDSHGHAHTCIVLKQYVYKGLMLTKD